YLSDRNVPGSDRPGTTVTFRPAGPEAKAYLSAAITTTVTLSRTETGWYVTGVERSHALPRTAERLHVAITDRAASNLIKRTLAAFGRKPPSEQPFIPAWDALHTLEK